MIGITGATGQLGQLIVAELLEKVGPKAFVAIVRTPSKAAELAAKGVEVREGDYSKPATLTAALKGIETLLLISSSSDINNGRVAQHEAVIAAAKSAGVKLIAYTSVLGGEKAKFALAADHVATEKALRESGVPFVLLRNGWYFENYTSGIAATLQHGLAGASGEGRIAGASRADFAAATVAVLVGQGHAGKIYELAGDSSFTKGELAAEIAKQSGKPVPFASLNAEQFKGVLLGAGLPPPFADILVEVDLHIAQGALDNKSGDLSRLIGRPTTSLSAAVASALAANR